MITTRKGLQALNATILITYVLCGILLATSCWLWLVVFHLSAGGVAYGIWFGRYQLVARAINPRPWTLVDTATATGFVALGYISLFVLTFEE